ncbi:MAG: hypothetical protein Q9166_006010 [cf. Caloplaca sp. 2 TL-2023]
MITRTQFRAACPIGAADVAQVKSLEFLSPLRRLKVTKPITFDVTHKTIEAIEMPCDAKETKAHAQLLETSYRLLTGEPLSKQEMTWKYIKAYDRPQHNKSQGTSKKHLAQLWEALNHRPEAFDKVGTQLNKYLFTHRSRQRRYAWEGRRKSSWT